MRPRPGAGRHVNRVRIRRAAADEVGALSEIAWASKASWGYSDEMMQGWRDELTGARCITR